MDGHLRDGVVFAGGDARHRFYDSRGYGRPLTDAEREEWGSSGVALSRVEAAHLLGRGDLAAVRADGERLDFRAVLASADDAGVLLGYLVYADLRGRGFYLSPAREGWPNTAGWDTSETDFVVYPRGSGPGDGEIAHRVRVVGERTRLAVADLPEVLAVVDEESDVTYLRTGRPDLTGTAPATPSVRGSGTLLADRAVLWDPPVALYRDGFYGQPMPGRDPEAALQLSLVEAAYLAGRDAVTFGAEPTDEPAGLPAVGDDAPDYAATVARGRAVEGERFDRRLRAYAALRERGLVPKTGFKFGADYRTYAEFDTVEDLAHSELLVRVLPAAAERTPRALALDVRLAHGVRKRIVFGLVDSTGADDIEWRVVERMTP
jgi:tRNA-intron endonuclease